MEMHQLRYFLAVAQTGSFSRAAELCHVAQPSLSQQIQKLERELQERLFDRERHGAVLTEAGERLLPRAEKALGELEIAKEEIRDLRGQVSGPLRLGVLPTIAPYYLPKVLPALSGGKSGGRAIGLRGDHRPPGAGLALSRARLGAAQPAAAEQPRKRSDLQRGAAAGPAARASARRQETGLSLDDLREESFILLHESHCLGEQALVYCRNQDFRPRVSCRSEQLETVKQLIAAGLGVSLLPAMACGAGDHLAYRPLSDPRPSRAIHVAWGKQQSLSRAARAFRRFVAAA